MNKLFPVLDKLDSTTKKDEVINKPIFTSVEYTIDTIVDKIINIEELDKEEIKSIIIRQHRLILNYDLFLSSRKTRMYAQRLFSDAKFLEIFYSIIGLLDLSEHEMMCLNKLAYDYYIIPEKDNKVSELLLAICNATNNIEVIKLSSKLSITNARILSMISRSTFRVEKKIKRINNFLVKCNADLSAQDILDIMFILYDRFTDPIIYTMLESKPDNLTPEQSVRFDTISSVIITILDSMTSANIKKVLYDYAFMLRLKLNGDVKVRFSMKTIPNPRIQSIIQEIETDPIDKLIVP